MYPLDRSERHKERPIFAEAYDLGAANEPSALLYAANVAYGSGRAAALYENADNLGHLAVHANGVRRSYKVQIRVEVAGDGIDIEKHFVPVLLVNIGYNAD
jgi:hypothetical protein